MKRLNIFGVHINATNLEHSIKSILELKQSEASNYICFPDVSVVVNAQKDPQLNKILNNSLFTFPDGKPLAIYAKLKGYKNVNSVSGYWLIKHFLKEGKSHFFYGADKVTLEKLKSKIELEFPEANILGYKAPPVIDITSISNNKIIEKDYEYINTIKPDFIWIGVSSPKQDYLMSFLSSKLDQGLMLGVGGVFDYLAGTKKKSPEWIKKISMRWLYRLLQEPGRLWKRYLFSIINFSLMVLKELFLSFLNRTRKKIEKS